MLSLWPCGSQETGKFFKRWEYQTTLFTSRETCMHIKKQQLKLDMEQQTGSILGKEYIKAISCHPVCLTCMQCTSCELPGWMKHKLESRLPGEISITSDMHMTPLLWLAESKEELQSLLMKLKEESEKSRLKLSIQKMKIMAFGPITSWQIDGETMETVTDFIFLDSKITVEGVWNREIKRCLVLGKKSSDKPTQCIKNTVH